MGVRLDYKQSWAPKNWYFWTVVLKKTLESPLYCKEIQPVDSKGDQSWDFFGRNDAKAETPVLWPPHVKSWLIGKASDAGRDWGAGGEGDDRGWDGWMISPAQWTWFWASSGSWWWLGSLACCSPWGHKELDMTEQLNNNQINQLVSPRTIYFISNALSSSPNSSFIR